MAGNSPNYDVTSVSTTGAYNNTTSFTKKADNKYQFNGTVWNDESYIVNDKNKDVMFEDGKAMTIDLNSRYKNGGAAKFSNLDKKHTGISYDLLDKFIEAAARGELEDVDHEGYTRDNMVAFGQAFDALQAKKRQEAKSNPYKKAYTNMKDKTTFTFTADELRELYTAAGFRLTAKKAEEEQKAEEQKPAVNHEPDEPAKAETVQAVAIEPVEPVKVPEMDIKIPEMDIKVPDTIGSFAVGTEQQFNSDNMLNVNNKILEQLGVKDADNVHIDFGGLEIDDNGNITQEVYFTFNGEQYIIQKGNVEDLKVVKIPTTYNSENTSYETRYNEKTGMLQERKAGKFLGLNLHKWKNVDGEIPRVQAKRLNPTQAQKAEVQSKTEAETREEFLQNSLNMSAEDWAKQSGKIRTYGIVENADVEVPSYAAASVLNEEQRANLAKFAKENTRSILGNNAKAVTLSDGTKAIKLEMPSSKGKVNEYYQVKVGRHYPTNDLIFFPGEKIENAQEQE